MNGWFFKVDLGLALALQFLLAIPRFHKDVKMQEQVRTNKVENY